MDRDTGAGTSCGRRSMSGTPPSGKAPVEMVSASGQRADLSQEPPVQQPRPIQTARKRPLLVCLALLSTAAALAACGGDEALSADSTCKEILTGDPAEADAAINEAAIDAGADYAGNINLTLSIRSACGSQPDATLGEVVDRLPK